LISYREHLDKTYNPLILQIRGMGKPVVAAVNGPCAGAAFGVALACDLRIASSSTGLFSSNKFSAQNPILKAIHATKQCFLTVFRSKMPWRCGLRPLESRTEQP